MTGGPPSAAQRKGRRGVRLAALVLFACGLWWIGQGSYIQAKALLAQALLRIAWDRTRDGGDANPPWPWADTWPVARLSVPDRGIEVMVLAGASGRTLAFGPGLVTGTARPGEHGISVVGGHRDTHFRFLSELETGDELLVETPDRRQVHYRVTGTRIADYRHPGIDMDRPGSRLYLTTCYPFDALTTGGPLRYLVVAEPLKPVPVVFADL